MIANPITRDERTAAVESASYRWAYLILSYGLLVATGYRAFVSRESSWDLLALVIVGGGVASLYQGQHRVLSRRWVAATVAALAIAVVLAAVIALTPR